MAATPNGIPSPEYFEEHLQVSLEEFIDRLERGSVVKDGVVPIGEVVSFIRGIAALKGSNEQAPLRDILWWDIIHPISSSDDTPEKELSRGETVTLNAEFSGEIVALLSEAANELSQYIAHGDLAIRTGQLAKLLSKVPRYDFRPPTVTPTISPDPRPIEHGNKAIQAVPLNLAQRDDLVKTLKGAGEILIFTDIGEKAVKIALSLEAIEPVDVVAVVKDN